MGRIPSTRNRTAQSSAIDVFITELSVRSRSGSGNVVLWTAEGPAPRWEYSQPVYIYTTFGLKWPKV